MVGGQTLSYMAFTYQGHSSLTPTHLSPLQRRRSSCWVSYCSAERHGDRKRDRDGERGVVVAERSLFVISFLLIPFFTSRLFILTVRAYTLHYPNPLTDFPETGNIFYPPLAASHQQLKLHIRGERVFMLP